MIRPWSTRAIALAFGLYFVAPAAAQDDGTLSLQVENDFFARATNSDEHYTNGMRLSYLSPRIEVADWLYDLTDWGTIFADEGGRTVSHRVGFALGQSIFTPDDTESRALVPDDRPYASWLYGAASLHVIHEHPDGSAWQDVVRLDLGLVGPDAYGEQVQNEFHDVIGVADANGWDNQLHNEPTANLTFERQWRTQRFVPIPSLGLEVDLIPNIGASAGNVLVQATAGATLRIGRKLGNDFGPPRIRPGLTGSEFFHTDGSFGWYVFGGAQGRAVLHNIFLDGNTFRKSHRVTKRPFVFDLQAGIAVTWDWVRITYTHILRAPEFIRQSEYDQFGALSVSFRL